MLSVDDNKTLYTEDMSEDEDFEELDVPDDLDGDSLAGGKPSMTLISLFMATSASRQP